MHTPFKKLILTSVLALALTQVSYLAQADTLAQDMTEVSQSVQISTAYTLSPFLRTHDLQVSVQGNKATLTGKVEAEINKDLAMQIALGVSGIKEVDNQITIEENYVAQKKDKGRNFGAIVDDATITASVKSKLLWSKFAEGLNTHVDTEFGKVTLKGTADTEVAKELAGRLAINTNGVASVDNQLKIKNEMPSVVDKAKKTMDSAGQSLSDSWITTKVKSTFMYSSNINGSQISVSTENGKVNLSGKVSSGAERALAMEIADNVRGVKAVTAKELIY